MVQFNDWCSVADTPVGTHALRILSSDAAHQPVGVAATAAAVPGHYASDEHVARVLKRLGKPAAAQLIQDKLPTTKSIRSGDLGEILATEYIVRHLGYDVPVKRLRWKDHRNMAMRGEDAIGIARDQTTSRLQFLKAEAKSRVMLTASVVAGARKGLDKDGGLPSAHALHFISECLLKLENTELVDAIDDAQLKYGITAQSVRHLLFTFSGNEPNAHLTASLNGYTGAIAQVGIGLRVEGHADFVKAVYEKVIANAGNA